MKSHMLFSGRTFDSGIAAPESPPEVWCRAWRHPIPPMGCRPLSSPAPPQALACAVGSSTGAPHARRSASPHPPSVVACPIRSSSSRARPRRRDDRRAADGRPRRLAGWRPERRAVARRHPARVIAPRPGIRARVAVAYLDDPEVTDLFVNGALGALRRPRQRRGRRSPEWRAAEEDVRDLAVALIGLGGRHIDDATPVRRCAARRRHPGACRAAAGRRRGHRDLDPGASAGPRRRSPTLEERGMFDDRTRATAGATRSRRRENLLVTGAAGAGKTTLLAALLAAAPHGERIVTIEDVAELRIDHPHHVRLEARQANLEGAGAIGLARLVREALRMRPDRLVVGECRGEEVRELLTALNTGHDGGAGTLHANSLRRRARAPRGARRARGARRPRARPAGGQRDRARAPRRARRGRHPPARRRRAGRCSTSPDGSGSRRSRGATT